MNGKAIGAEALGRDGLGLLTVDFGRTRLAEVMRPPRDQRAAEARGEGAELAIRPRTAPATRP